MLSLVRKAHKNRNLVPVFSFWRKTDSEKTPEISDGIGQSYYL